MANSKANQTSFKTAEEQSLETVTQRLADHDAKVAALHLLLEQNTDGIGDGTFDPSPTLAAIASADVLRPHLVRALQKAEDRDHEAAEARRQEGQRVRFNSLKRDKDKVKARALDWEKAGCPIAGPFLGDLAIAAAMLQARLDSHPDSPEHYLREALDLRPAHATPGAGGAVMANLGTIVAHEMYRHVADHPLSAMFNKAAVGLLHVDFDQPNFGASLAENLKYLDRLFDAIGGEYRSNYLKPVEAMRRELAAILDAQPHGADLIPERTVESVRAQQTIAAEREAERQQVFHQAALRPSPPKGAVISLGDSDRLTPGELIHAQSAHLAGRPSEHDSPERLNALHATTHADKSAKAAELVERFFAEHPEGETDHG